MSNSLKAYYEFIVNTPAESREAVIYKLSGMGSGGFFEKNESIVAYFEAGPDVSHLCDELEKFRNVLVTSGLNPDFSYDYTLLPPSDWNEEWKKNFSPINVGDNLTIVPSWLEPDPERISIIIDPGMAFGTGHHETTKRCLMLIESLSGSVESVLDIGAGTGVLAIAASRLGAGSVTCIDIDPAAVELAQRNVKANSLSNITILEGGISTVSNRFHFIIANLISGVLIEIANELVMRLHSNGTAILKGMIIGQEEGVTEAMQREGLVLSEKFIDDKWVTLVFRTANV